MPEQQKLRVAYFLTHPIQYQSPMIRAVLEDGIELHVIYGPMAAEWSGHDPELGRKEEWDVPLLDGYPHQHIASPFSFGLAGLLCLRPRIRRVLESLHPDAVWIHGWGDVFSVAAWNVAWQLGIPVLLRGESHLKCLKGGILRRWLHRQVLSNCFGTVARFLAVGSANRQFYLSYGVPEDKIFDVPYAVDNDRFSNVDDEVREAVVLWRKRLGIGSKDTVIGFFGKIKRIKRPDLALRAVALAAAELPAEQKPWLLFVGDGPWRGHIESLARKVYPDRTLFLGFQNQSRLPIVYRVADLLVLPSDFEPWGLVVNEAMCAGTPAVVSDRVGAAVDLVENTGRVFQAGSATLLAKELQPWLKDRHLLREAGRRAAQRVQSWSIREDVAGLREALKALPRVPAELSARRPRTQVVAAYLGVHQVFQMGAAAAEAGRLEHFYCSLIRFPHRWGDLLARWLFIPSVSPLGTEVLPPERVSETPLPLLVQRVAERCRGGRKVDPIGTNRWFATQVASHLKDHPSAGVVVGGETCALELFVEAKKREMRCMLDCHGIPTDFLQQGINRAAEELGLSAPTLLDSLAMAERKHHERQLADVLVVCSEMQRQIYLQQGLPPEKLRVVPLWVDADFWHLSSSRQPSQGGRPLKVLHAGAGSLAKGLPYLLEALDLVPNAEAELTLVGPTYPDMKGFLKKARVPVHRLSYCPRAELRQIYWDHDVLVMASLGDSFGFVAVEAMACGLPVIVTDRCGAPVPDPSWRVPAFSAAAIAERLSRYASGRSLCFEDGLRASEFARQLTSQRYRSSIRAIYDELLPA
ncbi:MAG TPA: glycosyltransferase family 4 protein [Prosthecobacter sp.]